MTLPQDVYIWVEKIKELQSLSKENLCAIGDRNRKEVFDNFSLARMHGNYNKLYYK